MPVRPAANLSVALAAFALAGGAAAQSMKPGLWELRQQRELDPQMQAQMDEMRQQMAALPADQRKMMESMMAQRGMSIDGGAGTTAKVCITKEQAERDALPVDDRGGDCRHDAKRSGAVIRMRFECTKPPSKGEGDITIAGPEAYSMQMRVTSESEGRPVTMVMMGQGRWLASDCGTVKPALR